MKKEVHWRCTHFTSLCLRIWNGLTLKGKLVECVYCHPTTTTIKLWNWRLEVFPCCSVTVKQLVMGHWKILLGLYRPTEEFSMTSSSLVIGVVRSAMVRLAQILCWIALESYNWWILGWVAISSSLRRWTIFKRLILTRNLPLTVSAVPRITRYITMEIN